MTVIVMLVHAYYGYTAHGGPAGVGEAVGRSVRATLLIVATGLMTFTLAVYGQAGDFHFAS